MKRLRYAGISLHHSVSYWPKAGPSVENIKTEEKRGLIWELIHQTVLFSFENTIGFMTIQGIQAEKHGYF